MTRVDIDRPGVRRWLGLALLATAVLVGATLLFVATGDGSHPWLPRIFTLLGLGLVAAYGWVVFLPAARREARLSEEAARLGASSQQLQACLEDIRHFDLVRAVSHQGALADDVRHSVDAANKALAGLVQQIQSSSVEVATSALTVQETSSNLASGSTEQAAAVVEITATMEQLARTAAQIAANAASQADLATRAERAGHEGATAIEAAVAGVESVRTRMDAISERADSLGRRSREIYRVLELINEISQETHILALNAAIEAAAAGEHGERFSVVADEVRRLAERSRESVESVRTLLEEFTDAIRAVVVATEEGSKAAEQVLEMSRATAATIDHLSGALIDTSRQSREISLATQEQQTASDQVVMTLKEVSEVIQRMAEGLKQFTGAADSLNRVALAIQLLTQSFRIDSPHSLKHQVLRWGEGLRNFASNLEAAEGVLQDLLDACPYVELAYLVDANGAMVAFRVNRDLVGERSRKSTVSVGQVFADRPWFQAVKRDARTALTPLYESIMTGDVCFTIAAAVVDLDGRMAGTLGVDVNVRNWTRI